MDLRKELLLSVGLLVLLNVMFALGAIALFGRMGPAIGKIMEANVFSIVAAEQALAEFATAENKALPAESQQRVRTAIGRVRGNVTEASEKPLIRSLEQNMAGALAGERPARTIVVHQLLDLIEVNRKAMRIADRQAQRLGQAGAWSAVLVGIVSLLMSLVVVARLRRRVIGPIGELHRVLEAAAAGETYRRCRSLAAPVEIRSALASVNLLLDGVGVGRKAPLGARLSGANHLPQKEPE